MVVDRKVLTRRAAGLQEELNLSRTRSPVPSPSQPPPSQAAKSVDASVSSMSSTAGNRTRGREKKFGIFVDAPSASKGKAKKAVLADQTNSSTMSFSFNGCDV